VQPLSDLAGPLSRSIQNLGDPGSNGLHPRLVDNIIVESRSEPLCSYRARSSRGDWKVCHMARALVGYVGTNNEQVLALEVARLRRRVAELETELAEARDRQHTELDLDLHRLAEASEPALT
jgi:hypothetical protein